MASRTADVLKADPLPGSMNPSRDRPTLGRGRPTRSRRRRLHSGPVVAAPRRAVAIAAILLAGLSATSGVPAAHAAPTASELSNCVSNVTGVARPERVKRAVCATVISALASIGPRLGLAVIPLESKQRADGFQLEFAAHADPAEPRADAGTEFNGASPCFVQLYPHFWKPLSAKVGREGRRELTHEVVHCYQDVVWGSEAVSRDAPKFISEGTAEYLADDAVGYAGRPSWWPVWFNPARPQPSLLKRSYDALGWYALIARVTGSLWPRMATAWRAYSSSGSEAFIRAIDGDEEEVEKAWGPSLVNHPSWGAAWVTTGPGLAPGEHSVGAYYAATGKLQEWAGEVDLDPPVHVSDRFVLIRVSGGYGAVHDESGHQLVGFVDQLFCTDPHGCPIKYETCDNGTNITVPRLNVRYTLAVSSGAAGGEYTVASYNNVNSIAPSVSPCDPDTSGVSRAALEHYAADPCGLLTSMQVEGATGLHPRPLEPPTDEPEEGIVPSTHAPPKEEGEVGFTSAKGGVCLWNLEQPIEQDFLIAQASIEEQPWLELASETALRSTEEVRGLGEDAICVNGPYAQGLVPALYIELNSEWYLGVSGGHSCAAVIEMGKEAYTEVEGF